MRRHHALLVAAVLLATIVALHGCSEEGDPMSPGPGGDLPSSVPPASTPQNLVVRFEAAWEYQSVPAYDKLLTADFRFTFSAQTDPALVDRYGDDWSRADELTAASNLFLGFVDGEGGYQPASTSIVLVLVDATIGNDPAHADSADWYKVATVPAMNAAVGLASTEEYVISGAQELHLVRGDAAVLAPGQEARSDRWYVARWEDHSTVLGVRGGNVIHPSRAVTWGGLKDRYR